MAELNTVVRDGFDHEAFHQAIARHGQLREQMEALDRLLPHGARLAEDLFCIVFKLNAELIDEQALLPSLLINRAIVLDVLESTAVDDLRRRTALDVAESANAASRLAARTLNALKRKFNANPEALLRAARADADERELDRLKSIRENETDSDEPLEDVLTKEERRLRAAKSRHRKALSEVAGSMDSVAQAVSQEAEQLPQDLASADAYVRGLGVGTGGPMSAERRLELGQQIMRSDKLRRLARMVGAFREIALESRRKRPSRLPQTVHSINQGSELERLLPTELIGLRTSDGSFRRGQRLDFKRRYVEKQLSQYELKASAGRGPMVVCLDGSSSMAGTKELWSKAVALTLLDIAKREHRRCLGIIFSAGGKPYTIELTPTRGEKPKADPIIEFAEHFPGGGTEFEPPLRLALEAVTEGDFRRGDIIFITDGQASLSSTFIDELRIKKRRSRFRVFAVTVGKQDGAHSQLGQISDEIQSVESLTANVAKSLFEDL